MWRSFSTVDIVKEVSKQNYNSQSFLILLPSACPHSPPPALAPLLLTQIDIVNELFAEAREEIEFAKEEAETVYFNESVKTARKAVDACLARWEALLGSLPEEERGRTMRSMGLKIAQLQV